MTGPELAANGFSKARNSTGTMKTVIKPLRLKFPVVSELCVSVSCELWRVRSWLLRWSAITRIECRGIFSCLFSCFIEICFALDFWWWCLAPGSPVLRNILGSDIGKVELMALSTCCRHDEHGWRDWGWVDGSIENLLFDGLRCRVIYFSSTYLTS